MNPEVLIIGCGFLGEAAADLFCSQGKRVMGLVRSEESERKLAGRAFEVARCDVTETASLEALGTRLQHIPLAIYAVSSNGGGVQEYAAAYREGLRRILQIWQPQRVIFVSSTSVYAQDDDSWVTEESPTQPTRETAKILLEAEAIALKAGGIVARLTGIYGPGRSMLLRKFLANEAVIEAGGDRFLNQIHRNDGATALLCLADPATAAGIYNVSDNTPTTQREIYGWIADFLHRPLPPNGPVDPNRKRGITSKRVSNTKLRSLGWDPRYPSYQEALPSLIATG